MNEDTAHESRHEQRIHRIEALFSWQFYAPEDRATLTDEAQEQFSRVEDIIAHLEEIDAIILRLAPKHDLITFNKIDLAILRQGLYELLYTDTPAAVVIDEAVEIAKEYGSEETPSFVHGVLGNVVDERRKDQE